MNKTKLQHEHIWNQDLQNNESQNDFVHKDAEKAFKNVATVFIGSTSAAAGVQNKSEAVLMSVTQPGNEAEIEFWGRVLLISESWPSGLILRADGWIYYLYFRFCVQKRSLFLLQLHPWI